MTLQYAICINFKLPNSISPSRISQSLLNTFLKSKIIDKIFNGRPKPIEYLTFSRKYTSQYIKKCPHSFLLENEETFSIRTFKGKGKMFAPKVVGQPGDNTINYFFGHLYSETINRNNFKDFCITKIDEILPIIVDYALVSDYNCWVYLTENDLHYEILKREDLPDLTYSPKDFNFTQPSVEGWRESNTVKYKGRTVLELQIHNNRSGYKIRLHRENFPELLKKEKEINNSMLGDTAELAICKVFNLDPGVDNGRLTNNSDKEILKLFIAHYEKNKTELFPLRPVKYTGTAQRDRGSHSKSGIDFNLEDNCTLSVKTNKSKSYKVCPPEIGQPSPKTFDLYFADRGWYQGSIDEEKFRKIVTNPSVVSILLREYIKFLNECDFLLWSLYIQEETIESQLIRKNELERITFNPEHITYSNDFTQKSSVTIQYNNGLKISIGEFQVHSARNSLKFRFNFGNLLKLK